MNEIIIPLDKIKKLREKTLIGIKDCKIALIEAKGDLNEAEKILKKKGLIQAERRTSRSTANGAIFIYMDENKAAMLELTCETEFVAKNKVFRSTGEKLVKAVAESELSHKTEYLDIIVKETISVFKENMILRNITYWNINSDEFIGKYIHDEGRMASLIKIRCKNNRISDNVVITKLANDLAIHICALNPIFLNKENVDYSYLKEQKEIFRAQALNIKNIDEKTREAIESGKLKKHLSQICLMEQNFVKDDKKTVEQIISEISGANLNLEIVDFVCLSVGQI